MPPLPTIAGVWRVAMLWDIGAYPVKPVNVFHIRSASADVTDTAVALAAAADQAYVDSGKNGFQCLAAAQTSQSFSIRPLDGATAALDFPWGDTHAGDGASDILPAVAAVVSFKTGQLGARGRGRMYLGPITEDVAEDGMLKAICQSDMLLWWNAFVLSLQDQTPELHLVVASYEHADSHDVVTVRVDTALGTQRRRQDKVAGR